jgi:hypothetical protein
VDVVGAFDDLAGIGTGFAAEAAAVGGGERFEDALGLLEAWGADVDVVGAFDHGADMGGELSTEAALGGS